MNDELTKVKAVEIEILQQFMEVCDKLNLRWFGAYGTVLGAIRHQGFIPWDDDIDVLMPRKDFEIFAAKAQEFMPKNYFVQSMDTEPEYWQPYMKLRRSDTTFWEIGTQDDHINHGVYMDIFPLDGYPTNKFSEVIFMLKRIIYNNFLYEDGDLNRLSGYRKLAAKVYRVFCGTLDKRTAAKKKERLVKKVDYDKSPVVSCMVDNMPKGEAVPPSVYGDGVEVPFENITIRVPKEWETYLTKLYGNYMEFPPVEERVPLHTCSVIDTEKSYLEYHK